MKQIKNFIDTHIKPFKSRSETDGQQELDLETIAAREQNLFSYTTLVAATRDFHSRNKLGEGGFGPVYKGTLDDGRQVAVKKLSHSSNQGKKEFVNEARLLGRVQHKNVVNLLGYCVHGAEKLLVYEYVTHESLDKILFDERKRDQLGWKERYDIILGVARGLMYLHEDAHTCIIHRDIKASNILLDDDKWTPKIADFGMARLFPEDQTQVKTRVAGTNGYMAPEYVMHGRLSVKADVFSFGVVMLELVCGKNSSSFRMDSDVQSLLEWVWRHYKKGRSLEVVDPALASTVDMEQVAMCIQIGLLCCQADPNLRPTMRRVVIILSKKPGTLDELTRPGLPRSRYRQSHPPGSLSSSACSSHGRESSHAASTSNESSNAASTSNTTTVTNSTSTLCPVGPQSVPIQPRKERFQAGTSASNYF